MRRHRLPLLVVALLALIAASSVMPAGAANAEPAPLSAFLHAYLNLPPVAKRDPQWPPYVAASVNLDKRGGQVLVYLAGQGWCGSGGCTLLILTPEGGSYRVVSKTTITSPPIRVLDHITNGWHDISVTARDRGAVTLAFTGTRYPGNPSLASIPTLPQGAKGTVVIDLTADHHPYALAAGQP